jgi:3-oxoacyl-[acyl-carrier protein] reductase
LKALATEVLPFWLSSQQALIGSYRQHAVPTSNVGANGNRKGPMTKLAGKTALVTGGSRGTGRASALALAAARAQVLVHYGRGADEADDLQCRSFESRNDWGNDGRRLDRLFAVNVRAPFLLVQQLLRILSKGSNIVFISSLAACVVVGATPAYAATKGAVDTMVKQFASMLGDRGIRVNAVAPSVVQTDMSNFTKTTAGWEFR